MQIKIDYREAKEILESQEIETLGVERVFLHQALGRILAQDILADCDMPESARSNMDGYAICSKFLSEKSKSKTLLSWGTIQRGMRKILFCHSINPLQLKLSQGQGFRKMLIF